MKPFTLALILALGFLSTRSAIADSSPALNLATQPSAQCVALATSYVKSTVSITNGAKSAKDADYSVTEYSGTSNEDHFTIQAYGLSGDDSDSLEVYEVVLRKGVLSGQCVSLIEIKLIHEN